MCSLMHAQACHVYHDKTRDNLAQQHGASEKLMLTAITALKGSRTIGFQNRFISNKSD